jgi:hypothetical protein
VHINLIPVLNLNPIFNPSSFPFHFHFYFQVYASFGEALSIMRFLWRGFINYALPLERLYQLYASFGEALSSMRFAFGESSAKFCTKDYARACAKDCAKDCAKICAKGRLR